MQSSSLSAYEQALQLVQGLNPEEKLKLIERLSHSLQSDLQPPDTADDDWIEFLDSTYASLADDPLERPTQPEQLGRDEIE